MNKFLLITIPLMLSSGVYANQYPEKLNLELSDHLELSVQHKLYTSTAKKAFYHQNSLEGLFDIFNSSIQSCTKLNKENIERNNLSFSLKIKHDQNSGGYYNIYPSVETNKYILEGVSSYYVDEFSDMPTPNKYLCNSKHLAKLNKSIETFIN